MRSIPAAQQNDKEQIVYISFSQYNQASRTLDIHIAQGTADANGVFTQRGNNVEVVSVQEEYLPDSLDILNDGEVWSIIDARRGV